MKTKDLVYKGRENGLLSYGIYNNSVEVLAFQRPKKIKGVKNEYICMTSGGIFIRKNVILDPEIKEYLTTDGVLAGEFIDIEFDTCVVVTKDGDGDIHLRFATDADIKNSKNNIGDVCNDTSNNLSEADKIALKTGYWMAR